MPCERWIDAVSALSDGEDPGVDPRLVEAHLERCPACRRFRGELEALRRHRIEPAPTMPSIARRIVSLAAETDRSSRSLLVRALLVGVAISIMIQSFPELALGAGGDGGGHAARHLGAFAIAYAAGLLVVVARPARARTILPVSAILASAILITAAVDVAQGRVPFVNETVHVPELVSVLLVWLLAVPARRTGLGWRLRRSGPSLRALRSAQGRERHPKTAGRRSR